MEKTYTISEVMELQNQKSQLLQRLAIHKQREEEKRKELSELFAIEGVSNIQELSALCNKLNEQMQVFAKTESENIQKMKEICDELDRCL